MTLMTDYRALAGQTTLRVIAKAVISFLVVGLAALVSREGSTLAIIIIFMGVTGPAIRLVTMKIDGTYIRVVVSPVSKARFFLGFAGLWTGAVLLPLVPSVAVVVIRDGPVTLLPVILGTILATILGTLAGLVSRGLSDTHLAALGTAGLLIVLSIIRTPASVFLPYASLIYPSISPAALIIPFVLLVIVIAVLALAASRS